MLLVRFFLAKLCWKPKRVKMRSWSYFSESFSSRAIPLFCTPVLHPSEMAFKENGLCWIIQNGGHNPTPKICDVVTVSPSYIVSLSYVVSHCYGVSRCYVLSLCYSVSPGYGVSLWALVILWARVMVLAVSPCHGFSLYYGVCCGMVLAHVMVLTRDGWLRGSHGLSARRARRTKSGGRRASN